MAASDKNIVISPQRGSATLSPTIAFTGDGNDPVTLYVPDGAVGSLSFEGSAGQLFSITNNLTSGSIFSVNDVSGIPSLDIDASGLVQIAPLGGEVALGQTTVTAGNVLDVKGNVRIDGDLSITGTTLITNLNADFLDGQDGGYYRNASNINAGTIGDAYLPATISSDITGNAATATKLATSRTISITGDGSGSASFDGSANVSISLTIADDSHNHIIGNIDGLQSALDAKAPLASPALTGTPTAPTATAGTNTTQIATTAFVGTAVANLVDSAPGTLDTLNELAAALGDDPNFATTVTNSIATKLSLAGGQMTGNITFSGSQTVDGRDLSVDGAKLDGIESGATGDQTASEILTLIKTVDGASSGLDADLLDGINSGSFLRSDANDTASGEITLTSTGNPLTLNAIVFNNTESSGYYSGGTGTLAFDENFYTDTEYGTGTYDPDTVFTGGNGGGLLIKNQDGWGAIFTTQNTRWASAEWENLKIGSNQVWHAGNDGSGSGLDADTLDGLDSAKFLRADVFDTAAQDITFTGGAGAITLGAGSSIHAFNGTWSGEFGTNAGKIQLSGNYWKLQSSDGVVYRNSSGTDYTIWHAGNDGSGSGLDADLLDGQQGSYYLDYNNFTNTPSIPGVGDGTLTVQGSNGLTGSGTFTANQSTNATITVSHADTSTQASVDNSNGTVIQDVTLDGYGHVTGLVSVNLDGRYYTETESDARFLGISAKAADSNLLDGIDSGSFLRSDTNGTFTGTVLNINASSSSNYFEVRHGSDTDVYMRHYCESGTAQIADTFSDTTTDKKYIYFSNPNGSSDYGYIMHETSNSTSPDERNEGVLHLVPSDDNEYGDYVSIHGANDADRLKLHTDGTIETEGGIKIVDSNAPSSSPGIEVIGKRNDGNSSSAFAGKLLLAKNRTDAAIQANNRLGSVSFGGNHTNGSEANILYTAALIGVADGDFTADNAMPTALAFYTGNDGWDPDIANDEPGNERMRIDSSGRLLVGTSSASTGALGSGIEEIYSTATNETTHLLLHHNSNSGTRFANIEFLKTHGGSAVLSNQTLGRLRWSGFDGSSPITAGLIECQVDGTPGTDVMPGRLVFSTTADGASSPTERMRIASSGNVGIGTINPTEKLHVIGDSRIDGILHLGDGTTTDYQLNVETPDSGNNDNTRSGIRADLNGWENNQSAKYGLFIDIDSTATDDITVNRTKYGIYSAYNTFVPANASTSDGSRAVYYGIRSDLVFNDNTDTNYTAGKIHQAYAGYNRVRIDSAGGASNVRGCYNLVQSADNTNQTSYTIDNAYGTYSYVVNDGDYTTFDNAYGVYSHVNQDDAGGAMNTGYGVYSRMDRDAGTGGDGYAYYGVFQGTWATKFGIYLSGENRNYFSGDVGIGTTSPGEKLHVDGNIQIADGGSIISDAGAVNISADPSQTQNGSQINMIVDGTEVADFNNGGYLRFNQGGWVNAGVCSQASTTVLNLGGGANPVNSGFNVKLYGPDSTSNWGYLARWNTTRVYAYDKNSDYHVWSTGSGTERLVITSGGNVGIGTDDPSAKLHVSGGDLHVNSLDGSEVDIKLGIHATDSNFGIIKNVRASNSQNFLSFNIHNGSLYEALQLHYDEGLYVKGKGSYNTTAYTGNVAHVLFGDQEINFADIVVESESASSALGALVFKTTSGLFPQERLRISSSGNVGIGTTNPSQKLHVNGTALSTRIFTAGTPTNDPGRDITIWGSGTRGIYIRNTSSNVGYSLIQDSAGDFKIKRTYNLFFESEGLTLDSSGNLIVDSGAFFAGGATSSPYGNKVAIHAAATHSCLELKNLGVDGNSRSMITFYDGGGADCGRITIDAVNHTTAYNTSSDYRLKENIEPISDAILRIKQLKPCRFNFISNSTKEKLDGFIAHEAQQVVPECVTGTKDEVDENGNPIYQGIDQSKLVPLLTAALQEALQKISDLEERLNAAGM